MTIISNALYVSSEGFVDFFFERLKLKQNPYPNPKYRRRKSAVGAEAETDYGRFWAVDECFRKYGVSDSLC